jgi:hypothetical protein
VGVGGGLRFACLLRVGRGLGLIGVCDGWSGVVVGVGSVGVYRGVVAAESNAAGRAWVGPGHRVASKGILISRDGLGQYRPPSVKKRSGRYQSNFEWRLRPKGEWQGNGHLNIKRDP